MIFAESLAFLYKLYSYICEIANVYMSLLAAPCMNHRAEELALPYRERGKCVEFHFRK